jgi:hypothetical protein
MVCRSTSLNVVVAAEPQSTRLATWGSPRAWGDARRLEFEISVWGISLKAAGKIKCKRLSGK